MLGEGPKTDAPLEYNIYLRPISPTPADPTYGLINVLIYKTNLGLNSFIETILCDAPGICASAKEATDLTVANTPAKKIINRPAPISSEIVTFRKGGYIFAINIGLDKSYEKILSLEKKKEIFNQILSTFKFLDQNTDETANWKTYKNIAAGFQFKYPSKYQNPKLPTGPDENVQYSDGTEKQGWLVFETGKSLNKESFNLQFFRFSGTIESLKKEKKTPGTSKSVLIKRTKVAGQDAEWYTVCPPTIYPDNVDTCQVQVYFIRGNYGYFFEADRIFSENEINQILSTFRFN